MNGQDIVGRLKQIEYEAQEEHRAIIHEAWNAIIWLRAGNDFWAKFYASAIEITGD